MKVYFIGIGGIGVSSLVQYYLVQGHKVSGSDLVCSEVIEALKKKKVRIFIGQKAKNITKEIDLIIHSPAVKLNNPELKRAKELKIKSLTYPEALGELTKEYFTIAITGTHGKSTTTAMVGLLLIKAGLDPTVIVGTKVKEFGDSNFRIGKPIRHPQGKIQYLVIEACEYKKSFLNYFPDIAVITNIEPDHLDYFKNFDNVKKVFAEFTKQIKKGGVLITEKEYKNQKDERELKEILKVPGKHNIDNALAALAIARVLKIPDKISFKALSEYRGCWRRFEVFEMTKPKKYTIISDYGHHPTELKVTLSATREKYPNKKIYCVFQPHQHNRTYNFFDDFVKILKTAPIDKIIVTDIYDVAGREDKDIKGKVNSQKLVKSVNKLEVIYLSKDKIIKYLEKSLKGDEVVVIMGAGDIYDITTQIIKN